MKICLGRCDVNPLPQIPPTEHIEPIFIVLYCNKHTYVCCKLAGAPACCLRSFGPRAVCALFFVARDFTLPCAQVS